MLDNINKFKRKILKLNVDSFKEETLKQIDRYLDRKDTVLDIKKNTLRIHWKNVELELKLEKKGISYEIKDNDKVITCKYTEYENAIFIKSNKKSLVTYDLDDKYSYNSTNEEICKVYDKKGVENFNRKTIKERNYYVDKKTGEITIHEPDIMENYTENYYKWRTDENYILERHNIKYIYPEGTKAFIDIKNYDSFFLRYEMIEPNNKDIPDWGHYYGIDSDVAFKYFQKEANIDDVIDNFYSKKYNIKHSIYL